MAMANMARKYAAWMRNAFAHTRASVNDDDDVAVRQLNAFTICSFNERNDLDAGIIGMVQAYARRHACTLECASKSEPRGDEEGRTSADNYALSCFYTTREPNMCNATDFRDQKWTRKDEHKHERRPTRLISICTHSPVGILREAHSHTNVTRLAAYMRLVF